MPRSRGALVARNISKSYGDVLILDDFSYAFTRASRVGIVGPNGVGKSTLLRVLAGLETPDAGRIERDPDDLRVGYLAQEAQRGDGSPGQRARAEMDALAAAGVDVLLLDEPSNDLDAEGLRRLARIVAEHAGAVVAVSHDRAFLERMTAIVEFEADTRRIRTYSGGWSDFERQRTARRARDEQAYGRYLAERDQVDAQALRMREWQRRGYGQGRKKKKGRDLAKATEKRRSRVRRVEKPWARWQLQLRLAPHSRGGDVVVRLERAVIERHGFRLGPLDLQLLAGERVAVAGRNGAGKTTLMSAILGELPLSSGARWIGPGIVLGTLRQGLGRFCTPARLIDTFAEAAALEYGNARSLLAKFGLGPDDVTRPGASLSPGERARAALALLAAQGANALVLDEPTNNLDLEAIEQLEAALAGFEGALLLVTHDRRFLERLRVTRVVQLDPGAEPVSGERPDSRSASRALRARRGAKS